MEQKITPFYVGQEVVAVDAVSGSLIKNGQKYIVSSCGEKVNPVNGLTFMYVGVVGHHDWLRPQIFAPFFPPMQAITYTKILEQEPVAAN